MSKNPKKHRQYICLHCMKFWFLSELKEKLFDCDNEESIRIEICPNCNGNVHYVGTHKNRGDKHLFGERIAHLEYIKNLYELQQSKPKVA